MTNLHCSRQLQPRCRGLQCAAGRSVPGPQSRPGRCAGSSTMTLPLLLLVYTAATAYLVFWASLWIVHLLAIIYG